MVGLARANAARAGAVNAEFLHGSIENVPLPDGHVDVVISNCVINLSADKPRVLAEAFRVLRPGGRLGVSDVIAGDGISPGQRAEAEQRAGCTTGTVTAAGYRRQLLAAGFTQITITQVSDAGAACIRRSSRRLSPPRRTGDDRADAGRQRRPGAGDLPGGPGHRAGQLQDRSAGLDASGAARLPPHRHVATDAAASRVLGWVAASAVSGRCVYAGVIEHSVTSTPAGTAAASSCAAGLGMSAITGTCP